MNWFKVVKYTCIAGWIFSVITTAAMFVLLYLVLRSDKYIGKRVDETPLLKYSIVLCIGVILTIVFQIILFYFKYFV